MKKILLIAIALVGVFAALPPVLGMVYERQLTAEFRDMPTNPVMAMALENYERGLYESNGTVVLALTDQYLENLEAQLSAQRQAAEDKGEANPDAQAAMDEILAFMAGDVRINFVVRHGPVTFANEPVAGLAFVRATLSPETGRLAEFQALAGAPYLFWSEGVVGFDGTTVFTGGIPAMASSEQGNRFDFSGLAMTGSYDARGRALQISMSSDSLTFETSSGKLTVARMTLTGDTQALDEFVWVGDTRLDIGEFSAASTAGEKPLNVVGRELGFAGSAKANAAGDRVDLRVEYFLGDADGGPGVQISDAVFGVNLTSIDAQAYKQLMLEAQTLNTPSPGNNETDWEGLAPIFVDMLRASPGMEIAPLRFTAEGQTFEADVRMKFNAESLDEAVFDQMAQNPALAIAAVSAEGALQAPESLVNQWVANALRDQIEANLPPDTSLTDEQLTQAAAAQTTMALESWVVQGVLERDGDVLKSEFEYADGLLTIRGQVIPLGAL